MSGAKFYFIMFLLFAGILFVGYGMMEFKVESFEFKKFIDYGLGVSIVGILITLAIFVVSLRVSSVNQTLISIIMSENQRKVFLNIKSGDTFKETNDKVSDLSEAEIQKVLSELVSKAVLVEKEKSSDGILVKKYYKNF